MAMTLDVYATGHAVGGKVDRRAACAIILVATHADKLQRRSITFKLGSATLNLAQLKGALVGLLALNAKPDKLTLHTNSHYVRDMLAKVDGRYRTEPSSNLEAISSLRKAFENAGDVVVELTKFDSGYGAECLALAKRSTVEAAIDTGTLEESNGEAGLVGKEGTDR